MKQINKRGGGIDLVMTLAFLLFATIAFGQPFTAPGYNYNPPSLVEQSNPDQSTGPVLGIFETEKKAAIWLGIGGGLAMAIGSVFDGMAAKKATLYGTRDGNKGPYHTTRFVGRGLQVGGTACYSIGWSNRKWNPWKDAKRPFWRKHGQVIEGISEAAFLFCFNSLVSQTAYTLHKPAKY